MSFVTKMVSLTTSQHQGLHSKMALLKERTELWKTWHEQCSLTVESPKKFWAEAINTGCYLVNRCMIRSLLNKTSYELLNGRKPKLTHLITFGCKCHVLNNGKDQLGKFDAKSDEGILLEYSPQSKAHKVYNKRAHCVEGSVHVLFNETPSSNKEGNSDDQDNEPLLAPGKYLMLQM